MCLWGGMCVCGGGMDVWVWVWGGAVEMCTCGSVGACGCEWVSGCGWGVPVHMCVAAKLLWQSRVGPAARLALCKLCICTCKVQNKQHLNSFEVTCAAVALAATAEQALTIMLPHICTPPTMHAMHVTCTFYVAVAALHHSPCCLRQCNRQQNKYHHSCVSTFGACFAELGPLCSASYHDCLLSLLLPLWLQFPEKMIPKFTLLASRGRDLPIHGDGGATRR